MNDRERLNRAMPGMSHNIYFLPCQGTLRLNDRISLAHAEDFRGAHSATNLRCGSVQDSARARSRDEATGAIPVFMQQKSQVLDITVASWCSASAICSRDVWCVSMRMHL